MLLEVCCGGVKDAILAEQGGASRIELNSALPLGGLTPDIGTFCTCREQVRIPVIVMIRPREGGFHYDAAEYTAMQKSAEYMLKAGADGLAFGFLGKDRTVDEERTKEFVSMIHAYGKEAVFHRAFDVTISLDEAVKRLIWLGVDRILTSGGEKTALEGADTLARLQNRYGKQIEILAGSGIRAGNVQELIAKTKITQVHSSCGGWNTDDTARGNGVLFCSAGAPDWNCYQAVSDSQVRQIKQRIL